MTGSVREHIKQCDEAPAKNLLLFAEDPIIGQYRFSAIVSNLNLLAEVIWLT